MSLPSRAQTTFSFLRSSSGTHKFSLTMPEVYDLVYNKSRGHFPNRVAENRLSLRKKRSDRYLFKNLLERMMEPAQASALAASIAAFRAAISFGAPPLIHCFGDGHPV